MLERGMKLWIMLKLSKRHFESTHPYKEMEKIYITSRLKKRNQIKSRKKEGTRKRFKKIILHNKRKKKENKNDKFSLFAN